MGTSNSNTSRSSQSKHILPYETRRSLFLADHQLFQTNILNNAVIDNINKYSDILKVTETEIKAFINKHQSTASKAKINNFQELFIQLITEDYITNNALTSEYNVFNKFKSTLSSLSLTSSQLNRLHHIETRFQKEFEMKLNSIFILYDSLLYPLTPVQRKAIISNISFLDKFNPNIFTILITNRFIHDDDIVTMITEMIAHSKTMQIINIILYPLNEDNHILNRYGLDCKGYKVLFKIMKSVADNRYIKSLCLHSVKDYNIVLAPEIAQQIVYKLQSETLIAFHLGNFRISETFAKQFFFQIVSTRSICALSIESDDVKRFPIRALIKIIEQNVSLQVLVFICANTESDEVMEDINECVNEFELKEGQEDVVYVGNKSIISL